MLVQYRITVFGRVQGVGFRYAARQEARSMGLKGWVQNQADGSVVALVQGERPVCQAFIRWCHRGSGFSWVERVELKEEKPGSLSPFQII